MSDTFCQSKSQILKVSAGYATGIKALDEYIFNLFIEFDQKHHPDVFNGGAWIDKGFSTNEKLEPWEISLEHCKVIYS